MVRIWQRQCHVKKIGEKDYKEAEIISSLGIIFAVASGIIIAVLSKIFIIPLVNLIGGNASENLMIFSVKYLDIIIVSIPFGLYSITVYNQLRLCGNVKDGMTGLLAGMFSNMILDPILMFKLKMGFIGAGYATLIGQIIGCIVLTVLSNGNIPISISKAKCNKERIYHILAGGLPNFSRQAITSAALILLNVTAARYKESIIAALTVSSKVIALAYMIMIGWGQGFQPICAMNYGAKKYERVKKSFIITVFCGTVFLIFSAIILYIFSEQCIGTMTRDKEVIEIGARILRLQCFTLPFIGFFAVSSMLMQNIGQYFLALIISVSRQGLFYIPLLFILPAVYGEFGIYLAQPVSDFLSFILAIIIVGNYYFKIIKRS